MHLKNRATLVTVLVAVFLVVILEMLTKGWWTLIIGPGLLLALPVVATMQAVASKQVRQGRARAAVAPVALLQLLALVGFAVTLVGFGDTEEVLVFGFLTAQLDDPVSRVSTTLCIASGATAAAASVALLVALVMWRPAPPVPYSVPQ